MQQPAAGSGGNDDQCTEVENRSYNVSVSDRPIDGDSFPNEEEIPAKRMRRSYTTEAHAMAFDYVCSRPDRTCKRRNMVQLPVNGLSEMRLISLANENRGLLLEPEAEANKWEMRLVNFQLYDVCGRLVPLDSLSAEKDGQKYFICGNVIPYFGDSSEPIDTFNPIAVVDIRIRDEAWIFGYGEDEDLVIGLTSSRFYIYLGRPHDAYENYYHGFNRKCQIVKSVVNFLQEERDRVADYDSLIGYLGDVKWCPPIGPEELEEHAAFVISHVRHYDGAGDDDELSILSQPCIDVLCDRVGINLSDDKRETGNGGRVSIRKFESTKAVASLTVAKAFRGSDIEKFMEQAEETNNNTARVKSFRSSCARTCVGMSSVKTAELLRQAWPWQFPYVLRVAGIKYYPGDGVYLPHNQYKCPTLRRVSCSSKIPRPLCVGRIVSFGLRRDNSNKWKIYVRLRKFYRPDDFKSTTSAMAQDWNHLYISNEVVNVPPERLLGRCAVLSAAFVIEKKMTVAEYSTGGSHRFYFERAYVPDVGETVLETTDFVDEKASRSRVDSLLSESANPRLHSPLRTLDLYAGCGGLSEGLHNAGLSDTRWAIERDQLAAEAFRTNHPGAIVIIDDCNTLMNRLLTGELPDGLPEKDSVDMIVGGPPCQGFSRLNRYKKKEKSMFKNASVVTFLSFVDFYRPLVVVLENVKAFSTHGNGDIFRRTGATLKRLGYAVNSKVLDAAAFGLPQIRARTFILAVRGGRRVPSFPVGLHSFPSHPGPFRGVTVRDAVGDLAHIEPSDNPNQGGAYLQASQHSPYQRQIRIGSKTLIDHCVKSLSGLVQERIKHVPKTPGADWRNLPNLDDYVADCGITIRKMRYVKVNGRETRIPCKNQKETLIPYALAHNADRHNQWKGCYGRLDYDGYFITVTTNPHPMGLQGRVLHPEKDRVFSVREAARAQGFPDTYKFYGSVSDRYRQVGNAVPPPMAAAIAVELTKYLSKEKMIKVDGAS